MTYRSKTIKGLLGEANYERAYYRCGSCHWSRFTTDTELGLEDELTPGAKEVIALHGNLEPFEEAATKTLPKSTGLRVSAATVRRVSEKVGDHIHECRRNGQTFGPASPWKWHKDAEGKSCAYVSLDATSVPQQGPHGERAEGRMPLVGCIFNPAPSRTLPGRRTSSSRYVAGLGSLREIGEQLRREAEHVGANRAERIIGLTDGGNGLEDCLIDCVFAGLGPQAVLILDFWHAAQHVHEFAKLFFPDDESNRRKCAEEWCHTLKHCGGEQLLADLNLLDLGGRPTNVTEAHRQLTGYLRQNLHRMDYPTYTSRGWQIGSGTIESACKNVVGGRLKGAGMRWRPAGTTGMCQLRALFKSDRALWDAYWSRQCAG